MEMASLKDVFFFSSRKAISERWRAIDPMETACRFLLQILIFINIAQEPSGREEYLWRLAPIDFLMD
jgi:hypothetical protein